MNLVIGLIVVLACFITLSTFLTYETGIYHNPLGIIVTMLAIAGYFILAKLLGAVVFLLSLGTKDEINNR